MATRCYIKLGFADDVTADSKSKDNIRATDSLDDVTATSHPIVQPDGGWGWVVFISCLFCNGIVFGCINSFGILYVEIREKYGQDETTVSFRAAWVGSVCTCLTLLCSIMAGVVSDVIGIRKTGLFGAVVALVGMVSSAFVGDLRLLNLTFGLLCGMGFSCVFSLNFVILGHYFKRRMGLANGLSISGGAVLVMVVCQVLPDLLKALGLRNTILVLSGLVSVLIPCTATWKAVFPTRIRLIRESSINRRSMIHEDAEDDNGLCVGWASNLINKDLWRNRNYLLWLASYGVCMMGYYVPFVHLVKYVDDVFPGEKGSILVLCVALSSMASCTMFGQIGDFRWFKRLHVQMASFALYGACIACLPLCPSYNALIALSIALGLAEGAHLPLQALVAFDLTGEMNANQALGFLFGVMAIPATAGPPLAGLVYDHLGNYNLAFHLAGCFPILAAGIMYFVRQPSQVHWDSHRGLNDFQHDDDV